MVFLVLVDGQHVMESRLRQSHVVLGGQHGHRQRDVLEHIHNLLQANQRDVRNEVEHPLFQVEDMGHGQGKDVGHVSDWGKLVLAFGGEPDKFNDNLKSRNLIGVKLSQLSHCHSVGEDADFLLDHGGSLLVLSELGSLVNCEMVIPSFVVVQTE